MATRAYFAFARHALVAGLRHIGIQPGDEIGVPEVICRDVLSSLHAVDAIPRFFPVDEDLRPAGCGSANQARAVLMVNYFGFPQRISDFSGLWPEATLIEDNAHGFLSEDSHGIQLGSRTEVGITSFRKSIRVPNGAFLSTQTDLDSALHAPMSTERPSAGFILRSLTANFERKTNLPLQQLSRFAVRSIRKFRTGSALPPSSNISESELPSTKSMSQQTLKKLMALNEEGEIARRRNLFTEFAFAAKSLEVKPVFNALPTGCAPYGFPFFSSKVPETMMRVARQHHCEVISWPDLPSGVSVPQDHFYRQLYVVNFL
jgi:hypothetical protein